MATLKVKKKKSNFPATAVVSIAVLIMSFLIFGSSTNNALVHLDDDMMFDNLKLLSQSNYNIFAESFARDAMVGIGGDLYRPVQTFFLIMLYETGDGSLTTFHLFQLLLHALAGFVVYLLMLLFVRDKIKAIVPALIYTAHPLFTPLAAFIPAIGDQLLLISGVGSFVFFVHYLKTGHKAYLAAHILLFSCSIFVKETALMLPFVYVAYYLIFFRQKPLKVLIVPALVWVSIPIAFLILRTDTVNPALTAAHNTLTLNNIVSNTIYNIPSLFEFPVKFFFPVKLSFLASYNSYRTIFGLLIFALAAFLYIKKKADGKTLLFSLIWYIVFTVPPMLYRNPVFDYGEHRAFVPVLAVLLVATALRENKRLSIVIAILIPFLAFASFIRTRDFKNPTDFYTAIIENDPVPMAYLNRGAYLHKQKQDLRKVLDDYNKAIALKPDYATALYNRALLKSEDFADYAGAFTDLDSAIAVKPNYAEAFYHRGYLKLTKNNDLQEAIKDIDAAIAFNPSFVSALNNRGIVRLSYMNDTTGSLADFGASIAVQSLQNPVPHFYSGMHYLWKNDTATACVFFRDAAAQQHPQANDMVKTYCE